MSYSNKYSDSHKEPQGPGDARPTADQILQDEGLTGKLTDKVILITGCSSGIGVETARTLHKTGAHLFLTVRDDKKGEEVVKQLLKETPNGAKIDLLHCELDSLESVRKCAAEFLSKSKQLNILINNAGVMACPEGTTKDGFETQFGTNHLSHFLLFILLKDILIASATPTFNSRVVSLTSVGHRFSPVLLDDLNLKKRGYDPWISYGQAKSANLQFALGVERLYGSKGVHGLAVHPGGINTELSRHLDDATVKSFSSDEKMARQFKSPQQGAATTVWAAISKEWEGKGGKYLEDCGVAPPVKEGAKDLWEKGYAPHAYDQAAEKQLWDISLKLVGEAK